MVVAGLRQAGAAQVSQGVQAVLAPFGRPVNQAFGLRRPQGGLNALSDVVHI
jgi:hypothetical protein